ncbi:TPA: sigma-70 family RNA polymerase sigma factor [Candidatus Poribacteria bacterium]|nr:sigma-70 family RNA polymerase sigma factor [Candidatus Poribacteria bacterium]
MSSEEVALIQRVKQGDEEAFEQIFYRYQKKVYNVAYRMTGNRETAEDMTQEVFLRLFQKIRKFRGKSSFSTWLYRLTVNLCLDHLRKRNAHLSESLEDVEEGDLAYGKTPEEELILKERREAVQRIINSLPDKLRAIIILREIEGLSYRELAEAMGCSMGRVKSLLHEARMELKRRIEKNQHLFKDEGEL